MKRIMLVSWFFFAVPSVLCAAPLFNSTLVGNGGEGVLSDSQVYVRDLYELSLHQSPHFGPESDPYIRAKLQLWNPLSLTVAQQKLLVRKITDIKKVFPPLAVGLINAIRYHHWKYTDNELVLLEDESRLSIPENKRVSIANRYLSSILIQRHEFDRLDDANKIALIVHEAVYAFVLPQKIEPSSVVEMQSSALTRQITASLFSADLTAENLKPLLSFLSFDTLTQNAKPCVDTQLTLQTRKYGPLEDDVLREAYSRPFIPAVDKNAYPLTNDLYDKARDYICKRQAPSYLMVTLDETFQIYPVIYQSKYGPQIRLAIQKAPQLILTQKSEDMCTEALFRESFVISFNQMTLAHRTLCFVK